MKTISVTNFEGTKYYLGENGKAYDNLNDNCIFEEFPEMDELINLLEDGLKYVEKVVFIEEDDENEFETKYEETTFSKDEILEYWNPPFYTANLTNANAIYNKAIENLLNIYTKDELLDIKNFNEIGIVEYVAKDNFHIENDTIIRED